MLYAAVYKTVDRLGRADKETNAMTHIGLRISQCPSLLVTRSKDPHATVQDELDWNSPPLSQGSVVFLHVRFSCESLTDA